MKPYFSITIPKPCHEDWAKMTPNEKGRFCQSCSKTVVDFTKMNTEDIQNYIAKNRNQRICGHIKQSQLDTINLKIPETVIVQQLSFQRLFLLALLLSMGLTLFNCEDEKGKTKKIDSIEIVEHQEQATDSIEIEKKRKKGNSIDTLKTESRKINKKPKIEELIVDGMLITVGDIAVVEEDLTPIDSLNIKKPKECTLPIKKDSVVEPIIMGKMELDTDADNSIIGFVSIEQPPEFSDTPKQLTTKEKKAYFSERIQEIVKENFKAHQGFLDLNRKQRIFTQFTINEIGEVENIKVRAPHTLFEKEARRVINLLPKFKPGKQRGKAISMVYNLPITFVIED